MDLYFFVLCVKYYLLYSGILWLFIWLLFLFLYNENILVLEFILYFSVINEVFGIDGIMFLCVLDM